MRPTDRFGRAMPNEPALLGSIIGLFVTWPPLLRPCVCRLHNRRGRGLDIDFPAVAVTIASRLVALACNILRFLK
jgi:hypothetical protein